VLATEGNGREHVFFVAGNYDADRDLAIVGAVGGVERSAAGVEANLSAKVAAESGFKRGGIELRGMGRGWSDVWRHRLQTSSRMRALGARGD
jgi:hypothetical protein